MASRGRKATGGSTRKGRAGTGSRLAKASGDLARERASKGGASAVVPLDPKVLLNQVRRTARSAAKQGVRDYISTVSPSDIWGPQQPIPPMAPPGSSDFRIYDYPAGYNTTWQPRKYTPYTFQQLRFVAANEPLVAEVIERRKDEIAGMKWDIFDREGKLVEDDPDVKVIKEFLRYPERDQDGRARLDLPYPIWQRKLLHEMYTVDAMTLYPHPCKDGSIFSLTQIDGATIVPLIDGTGRRPAPPDPAYVQVIKGIPYRNFAGLTEPAKDTIIEFTADELIYFPRNPRISEPNYGFSQVEQLLAIIAWAIKAEQWEYSHYSEGTIPDALISVPETWTNRQIADFQAWFDNLLRGNTSRRAGGALFVPGGMKEAFYKEYAFTHEMWEWLARVICAAFHVSPQPYVQMMNRATSQTAQIMQVQEGLEPDKDQWAALKNLIIAKVFARPDLEFRWQEDEQVDPADRAKAADILLRGGQKTPNELREANGDDPYPGGVGDEPFIVAGNQVLMLKDIEAGSALAVAPPPAPVIAGANGKPGATANRHAANGTNGSAPKKKVPAHAAKVALNGVYREGQIFKDLSGRELQEIDGWLVPKGLL